MPNVQTRSEENGLKDFGSFAEAFLEAAKDSSVWKISFWLGNERIRLVKKDDGLFYYENLIDAVLKKISSRLTK